MESAQCCWPHSACLLDLCKVDDTTASFSNQPASLLSICAVVLARCCVFAHMVQRALAGMGVTPVIWAAGRAAALPGAAAGLRVPRQRAARCCPPTGQHARDSVAAVLSHQSNITGIASAHRTLLFGPPFASSRCLFGCHLGAQRWHVSIVCS